MKILLCIIGLVAGVLASAESLQPRFTEWITEEEKELWVWTDKIMEEAQVGDCIVQLVTYAEGDEYELNWRCFQVFDRHTGEFLQEFNLDVEEFHNNFTLLDPFEVADYNFDGYPDFSLYGTHAGPHTSSYYFVYDPEHRIFIDGVIMGSGLVFHSDQTIVGESSCCAGSYRSITTYKVVNNEMVPIEEIIYEAERDEDGDFVEDEEGNIIFKETVIVY